MQSSVLFTYRLTPSQLLLLLLLLTQCKKKEVEPQLPPETTTGAMTFGCKVDGKVFVPRDGRGQFGLYVQYVDLGAGRGGGYYLNIPATDWKALVAVRISTDSLLVEQGKTYPLRTGKGNAHACYDPSPEYCKRDQDPGELTITRFDQKARIVSGHFHFVGTDSETGRQVHVTDGRFDVGF